MPVPLFDCHFSSKEGAAVRYLIRRDCDRASDCSLPRLNVVGSLLLARLSKVFIHNRHAVCLHVPETGEVHSGAERIT